MEASPSLKDSPIEQKDFKNGEPAIDPITKPSHSSDGAKTTSESIMGDKQHAARTAKRDQEAKNRNVGELEKPTSADSISDRGTGTKYS